MSRGVLRMGHRRSATAIPTKVIAIRPIEIELTAIEKYVDAKKRNVAANRIRYCNVKEPDSGSKECFLGSLESGFSGSVFVIIEGAPPYTQEIVQAQYFSLSTKAIQFTSCTSSREQQAAFPKQWDLPHVGRKL